MLLNIKEEDNIQSIGYPQHSARARWPALNGQMRAQTVHVPRPERPEQSGVRKVQTFREVRVQRQDGIDNPAFEAENRYYLRLHSEIGSSQDYEDPTAISGGRKVEDQASQAWGPSRNQHSSREVWGSAPPGHYKRSQTGRLENENDSGVYIPPVDYLDLRDTHRSPNSPGTSARILSLQEAILDRTLRLKKVPEELKRGINKY